MALALGRVSVWTDKMIGSFKGHKEVQGLVRGGPEGQKAVLAGKGAHWSSHSQDGRALQRPSVREDWLGGTWDGRTGGLGWAFVDDRPPAWPGCVVIPGAGTQGSGGQAYEEGLQRWAGHTEWGLEVLGMEATLSVPSVSWLREVCMWRMARGGDKGSSRLTTAKGKHAKQWKSLKMEMALFS